MEERTGGGKIRKKSLVIRKMVVSLHPLSTGERPRKSAGSERRQDIEKDVEDEIACVFERAGQAGTARHETSQKVKASNSYNEEFDPGSG